MKKYIREVPVQSQNPAEKLVFDVVVVGGGMSGLCAAIASARQGAKTALIQDRSVFGGNASSETRMHIAGASCHWGKEDAAETAILMELQLTNKYLNDSYNYSIWDGVLWSAAMDTKNLYVYMNTTMDLVHSDGQEIQSIECYQMSTEKRYSFQAKIYLDCTGNGTLGYFAGAEYMVGREASDDFNEKDAPPQQDGLTMGNSIYFCARDTGSPVKFVRPHWAYTFDESDFVHRYHGDVVVYHDATDVVVLKPGEDYADHADQLVEKYDVQSGYWWIELGGDWDDIIAQAEDIRYELYKCVYGVWDHIKNGGDHGAENYELIWVGNVPGTRESRRLVGTYILTENDILENRVFPDAVAYGGWPMDEHIAGGFRAKGQIPSMVRSYDGLFSIPYGCFCSKTVRNMMMAGRNISASKLAMGATRVMATCAVGGEAAGTAAAMAALRGISPVQFGDRYMDELRQELLKNDCYIPGCANADENDLARRAVIAVSSMREGCEGEQVISGVTRRADGNSNLWCSNGISANGEWLSFSWDKAIELHQVRLTLDPNLSEERCISVSKAFIDKEPLGVANELVRDYTLIALKDGKEVYRLNVLNNYQRLVIHDVAETVLCDTLQICVTATNGDPDVRIYEVRVY